MPSACGDLLLAGGPSSLEVAGKPNGKSAPSEVAVRQGRMRRGIEGAWSKERERRNCGNRQQWVLTRVSQNGNMAWPASSNGGPPMAIATFTTPK